MTSREQPIEIRQDRLQTILRTGVYVLLLLVFVLCGALIVSYDALMPSTTKLAIEEGQVSPRNVAAPHSLEFESDVLTQQRRDAAMAAIEPVYDPVDASVGEEQIRRARQVLDYVANVRADNLATAAQKHNDIAQLGALELDADVIDALLAIEDDELWRNAGLEIVRVLDLAMRRQVREDNLGLERERVPDLIGAEFNGGGAKEIIQAFVSGLLRVNTFFNEELTRQRELEAADDVPAVKRVFAKGQMIIRAGEIATGTDIEALDKFSLLQVNQRRTTRFLGGLMAMFLVTLMLGLYVRQYHPRVFADPSFMILLGSLFLIFLGGAQTVNSGGDVQPYFYPASAMAFLIATLVSAQLAIVMLITLAALVGFMSGTSLEFAVVIGFSGTLGILSLGRTERLNAYFLAGGVVGLAAACVAVLFALGADTSVDLFTVFSQVAGALVNGLFSGALALVGLYLISNVMNIPTSLKIVELMQPNHPLLQRLLREAPGTYQHSLQVANLAELGAEQVNTNASLLRVAAMYHDVGKILNPHFFVENQADGINPHDALNDPWQSARIILGHVTEGERLSRRYRLPLRIREFIMEHHGTTQVMYFYNEALKRTGQTDKPVDIADFTYPGPRPQSRETAILMLADGCESSVRGRRPQNKQDIQETVDFIFESRLQNGQLDDSNLTLNDLRALRDTFLTALQGVFHPRIAYPGAPGQGDAAPQLAETAVSQLPASAATTELDAAAPADEAPVPEAEDTQADDASAGPSDKGPEAAAEKQAARNDKRKKTSEMPVEAPEVVEEKEPTTGA